MWTKLEERRYEGWGVGVYIGDEEWGIRDGEWEWMGSGGWGMGIGRMGDGEWGDGGWVVGV